MMPNYLRRWTDFMMQWHYHHRLYQFQIAMNEYAIQIRDYEIANLKIDLELLETKAQKKDKKKKKHKK